MKRKHFGSAMVDYIVPTAVVGLVIGLGVVETARNGTLVRFLASSQEMQLFTDDGYATVGDGASEMLTGGAEPETPTPGDNNSPVISTGNVGGIDVNYHEDGSSSFFVKDQEVNISSSTMDKFNEIMETTGTAGMNNYVVNAIEKLIEDHADEYAGSDVPVEYMTGVSSRNEGDWDFFGTGEATMVQMSVGDHMIIINKDHIRAHACLGGGDDIPPDSNIHVLEGTKTGETFNGTFTDGEYLGDSFEGSFNEGDNNTLNGAETPGNWWNYTFQTTSESLS